MLQRCSTTRSSLDNVSESMQDDPLKGKATVETLPSRQSNNSRRCKMYGTISLLLDEGDD
jgi:hypothetical protein